MAVVPRLLLITDEASARRHGRGVVGALARAVDDLVVDGGTVAGAVAVVVRARGRSDAVVADLCRSVAHVARPAGLRVFSHGRPDLVSALGLDGCHLPSASPFTSTTNLAPRQARLRLPPGTTLGVSCHPRAGVSGDVCAFADDDGVDYATWSPIFAPSSKVDARPPLGLGALAGHHTPVIALGGIDASRASACIGAGASGVAVLGAVFGAVRPDLVLRELLTALDIPWRRRHGSRAAATGMTT